MNRVALHAPDRFWFLWRIPLILAILTVLGLLVALLASPTGRWASWLALAVLPGVIAWHACIRRLL